MVAQQQENDMREGSGYAIEGHGIAIEGDGYFVEGFGDFCARDGWND